MAHLDGRPIAHSIADNVAGQQAEILPPLVGELFKQSGRAYQDLARVIVSAGPGAFTGVRVGLAFAKGLKIATRAEVLGVSSLECLTFQARKQLPGHGAVAIIDAKRSEVYLYAADASGSEIVPPMMLSVPDANELLNRKAPSDYVVVGSGRDLIESGIGRRIEPNIVSLDVRELASRAAELDSESHPAAPIYLREPDARLPS